MPLPHVRTPAVAPPYLATYTLGGTESFRLDAARFTVQPVQGQNNVVPTLAAYTQDGETILEAAATGAFGAARATEDEFAYSGPAAFGDDAFSQPPGSQVGLALHNFGAVPITSAITATWPAPPALNASFSFAWLNNPGAVAISSAVGSATVYDSLTVGIPLSSGIAAGHYALVEIIWTWATPFGPVDLNTNPSITDNVGGNVVDHPSFGTAKLFGTVGLQLPTGVHVSGGYEFYRIVNALSASDVITVTLNTPDAGTLTGNVYDVTGLVVGSPFGPVAGGNYTGFSTSASASPATFTNPGAGVPKWVGGVLVHAMYDLPLPGTLTTQFGRGLYDTAQIVGLGAAGTDRYTQLQTPDLNVGPNDRIVLSVVDDVGNPRTGDVLSGPVVWGIE